jgi:hypothetical protein
VQPAQKKKQGKLRMNTFIGLMASGRSKGKAEALRPGALGIEGLSA